MADFGPSQVKVDGISWYIEIRDRHGHEKARVRISEEDIELVKSLSWNLRGEALDMVYVSSRGPRHGQSLPRLLLGVLDEVEVEVDHLDRDRLNNRRENLRKATRAQNAENLGLRVDNKTGHRGVFYDQRLKKYRAYARKDRKLRYAPGLFDDAESAAQAAKDLRAALFTFHVEES